MLDLTSDYNASLFDGRGWHQPNFDLSDALKDELQATGRIRFDLRGIIQLNSGESYDGLDFNSRWMRDYPERVSIDIGQKAQEIHFLHSTSWGEATFGTEVARYVIHLADGSTNSVPLQWGVDVEDCWWSIDSAESKIRDKFALGLTTKIWENPSPEQVITSIDFISSKAAPAPFLVAITLDGEESGN